MYAMDNGVGEILLQCRERDGTLSGYDLPQIEAVSRAVSIPVVASGGCGRYEHMAEALRAGAHGVAAGAMFAFTDQTPGGAAKYLKECGFNTRVGG
jgi:cyclase